MATKRYVPAPFRNFGPWLDDADDHDKWWAKSSLFTFSNNRGCISLDFRAFFDLSDVSATCGGNTVTLSDRLFDFQHGVSFSVPQQPQL